MKAGAQLTVEAAQGLALGAASTVDLTWILCGKIYIPYTLYSIHIYIHV